MLELDPDGIWSHEETSLCSGETCKSKEGPTLSNDIWNKFNLLLTPPRTPLRDTDFDLSSIPEDLNLGSIDLPLLEGDDLEMDLGSLDLVPLPSDLTGVMPVDFTSGVACSHGQVHDTCSSCEKLALAGSELRHDCMWIGTCTADAHANQKSRIHHDSTCSHITDLMESQGSLEIVSRFTQLGEFPDDSDDEDDDDDDAASHLDHHDDDEDDDDDDSPLAYNHMSRPDTPSESSETDSDEEVYKTYTADEHGVVHEEVYTSGSPASTGMVHSDHTYYCLPPPSPKGLAKTKTTATTTTTKSPLVMSPLHLHTPSDSEDEIDVVSVGGSSVDSAYSCSTRTTTSSSGGGGGGSKRSATSTATNSSKKSRNNSSMVLSCSSEGSKKIFRIHTSALPSSPSSKDKRQLQEAVAESVKLKPRKAATAAGKTSTTTTTTKATKRHHQKGGAAAAAGGSSRKRNTARSDSDDPDKREMHNSLERMRRVDLRNAFEDLRIIIPDLVEKEKAPKVEILKKAAQYCQQIAEEERCHLAQMEKERKYKSNLVKRLHALQRQGR